jgi:hypothetical protein
LLFDGTLFANDERSECLASNDSVVVDRRDASTDEWCRRLYAERAW